MTRGATALAVVLGCGIHCLAGCAGASKPAYSPAQAKACAAIDAAWVEAVVAACYGKYALADCPAVAGEDEKRSREQDKEGCR